MKYPLLFLSCSFLTACGGGGSEPLSKDNTAPAVDDSAQCGGNFSAQRHFNKQETNIAYWQIEGDTLQTKPQVTYFTNRSSSLAETSYKGTTPLCELVANIFGADVTDTWQGSDNNSIKTGQQFKYTPELSVSFALPELSSLADWRAKGSPVSMPTNLLQSTLTVWYQNSDEQRFLQGDLSNNQKIVPLECDNNDFRILLSLDDVDEQLSSSLNPAYCEEVRSNNVTKTACLNASVQQENLIQSCRFAMTDIIIPNSQGSKTFVKLAAKTSANSDTGINVELTDININ
ncbi:hypothetical protein [Pseudoalteromonas phenolica]|nr:hypothetical protein [Pseudoalteromonas phenolica]MAD89766.1 hypothetical protein [Pseudoalteromonas sp.]MBE0355691.1 hypothetical protein [Pseudoalteromonas phenolica O-BC30]TMO56239.1 hypothetical protein CWC21_07885 [Pseudoalteromonas phenolica]